MALAFTIVPVLEAVTWLERHGYPGDLSDRSGGGAR
jgi:hypothetical protein